MNAGEHSWVVSANIAGLLGMENLLCVVYRCYYCWSHSQSPHWLNTIHRNTPFPSLNPGVHGFGKFGNTWGMLNWFEIAWTDESGKIHYHKFNIINDSYSG